MHLFHRWPILVLGAASAACIVILLWLFINFRRESRSPKDTCSPLGPLRDPRR
jgi:hypothetical protein